MSIKMESDIRSVTARVDVIEASVKTLSDQLVELQRLIEAMARASRPKDSK